MSRRSVTEPSYDGASTSDATTLQQLIQNWIDAEPGRSRRRLAAKTGIAAATIDLWFRQSIFTNPPRRETLAKLAPGLGVPLSIVEHAAYVSTGRQTPGAELAPSVALVIAAFAEIPTQRQPEVADLVLRMLQMFQSAR